jgi:endonuclease/exonuclease/phosphatase (EEP) superfamily protein YafD
MHADLPSRHAVGLPTARIRRAVVAAGTACAALVLAGCVSLTVEPRALLLDSDGRVQVQSLACTGPAFTARLGRTMADSEALDPASIRLLTWNIHKQDDPGWDRDLASFAASSDIVLLQEVVLAPALRSVVEDAGMRWVMASSFLYSDVDIGVITGSRKTPLASCTQRVVEPLIRIPKSAVISWFRVAGQATTLAVVNVHAINFAISLGGYRAQLDALRAALVDHPGPIIFAGDLNTWTDARNQAMRAVGAELGLTEITFREDRRSVFMGKQLDHVYARGLELVEADAIPVKSSDHNPVRVTFRLAHQASATAPAR